MSRMKCFHWTILSYLFQILLPAFLLPFKTLIAACSFERKTTTLLITDCFFLWPNHRWPKTCGYTEFFNFAAFTTIPHKGFTDRGEFFNWVTVENSCWKHQGLEQIRQSIDYYQENTAIIVSTLTGLGIWFTGSRNAPYIWQKCQDGMQSWEFFDGFPEKANVVGTPGAGFGSMGEDFLRLSAFGSRENVIEAMLRLKQMRQ